MSYSVEFAIVLTRKGREELKAALDSMGSTGDAKTIRNMFRHPDYGRLDRNGSKLWWWKQIDSQSAEMSFLDQLQARLRSADYLSISIGDYMDDLDMQGTYLNNPFGLSVSRKIVAA